MGNIYCESLSISGNVFNEILKNSQCEIIILYWGKYYFIV